MNDPNESSIVNINAIKDMINWEFKFLKLPFKYNLQNICLDISFLIVLL